MDPSMLAALWDSPIVSRIAFQGRPAPKGVNIQPGETDGVISVGDSVEVGYRLCHGVATPRIVVVFFHGNAELCSDVSFFAKNFYECSAAVIAVDYRGYGWGTGTPSLGTLSTDADRAADAIPGILKEFGLGDLPLIAHGRSIGATCAVHLAATRPHQFCGLVLESGLMSVKDLPMVQPILQMMMPNLQQLLPQVPEPVQTLAKMRDVRVPTLITHGDDDKIVPFSQAQAALSSCGSAVKRLERVRRGGHNDLHSVALTQITEATQWLYKAATAPPLTRDQVATLSVKQLKEELKHRSLDSTGCVEKEDLVKLLLSHFS
jgi:pimeloyl-ACP methyl ester carboxylesterase